MFNAGRHFVTFLLPHGAPKSLRPIIDEIIDAYSNLTMTSELLLRKMEKLKDLFRSGAYLNRTKNTSSEKSKSRFFVPADYVNLQGDFRII